MIGWRKLTSWALVYGLVAVATWRGADVPPNAKELLIWATGFFFGANALKPLMQGIKVNVGQGA
jgi:hypothetical protein